MAPRSFMAALFALGAKEGAWGCPYAGTGGAGGSPGLLSDATELFEGHAAKVRGRALAAMSQKRCDGGETCPPLPGEIAMVNNAFTSPGLTTTGMLGDPKISFMDLIYNWTAGMFPAEITHGDGVGVDLCYASFQTLPPPAFTAGTDDAAPKYAYPEEDLPRLMELADQATQRLQAKIQQDGPVVFAGCAVGRHAAKALCDYNAKVGNSPIDTIFGGVPTNVTRRMCDPVAQSQELQWPQAVTVFRISPDAGRYFELKQLLQDWRSQELGHLPNIKWAALSGVDVENGGAYVGGWGNQPGRGLYAKVVPCSEIPSKFKYQPPFYSDSKANSTTTLLDEYYQVWKGLCSLPLSESIEGTCSRAIPAPAPAPPPPEKPAFPPPTLEACESSKDYMDKSITCGKGLVQQWGNDTKLREFDATTREELRKCAAAFCSTYGSGTVVEGECSMRKDGDDNFYAPQECTKGELYMMALGAQMECHNQVRQMVSKHGETMYRETLEKLGAAVQDSAVACAGMMACQSNVLAEVQSAAYKTKYCKGFFADLDPKVFAWAKGCDQTRICSEFASTARVASASLARGPGSVAPHALAALAAAGLMTGAA